MINNLPFHIPLIFGLTTLATLLLFLWVLRNSNSEITRKKVTVFLIGSIIWLAFQAFVALKNIYKTDIDSFPPKIMLIGIFPTIVIMVVLFITPRGRQFIDSLPLKNITYLNVVRIPVEIVLFWLFLNKAVPELMTFTGRNFDILAGITAPLIAYFGFTKAKLGSKIILLWNIICLGLLIAIIINALLASPSPIQQFAFDQPNVALFNFPFCWLPTYVVPTVFFGHLVSIRQLLKGKGV